jgi:hypothetical protein
MITSARTRDRLSLLGFALMVVGAGMMSWTAGDRAAEWVFENFLRSTD